MSALGVSGTKQAGFMRFFSSHPPLDERIEYLQNLNELN